MNSYRLADIHPGLTHVFEVTIHDEMLERFRMVSGDTNPLHTDRGYAQSRGFADRVVYGMLTASFYSTLIGVYLPGQNALLQSVDTSFSAPVYSGDTLTVFGEVTSVHEVLRQIEVKAHITNQHGKKVSRATIRTGIHE